MGVSLGGGEEEREPQATQNISRGGKGEVVQKAGGGEGSADRDREILWNAGVSVKTERAKGPNGRIPAIAPSLQQNACPSPLHLPASQFDSV